MPLIYVNYPSGALSPAVRDALAEELTDVALDCEKLPASPFVKSTTWVYFNELPPEQVYHGGQRSSRLRSTRSKGAMTKRRSDRYSSGSPRPSGSTPKSLKRRSPRYTSC